ncbi:efflux RND transporter periplasmic adaptor subunit [Xanthomonas campestris pv. asclepiadis]|uniref:efflux RND transporter periplasmic adaptor subunit n=1 Tax=Xanthomonas campestris TaxID=339 RepID=UPI001E494275|nr:efflux RND transporter periplasmic adaptor subunit [Xanthomonas campestris]MCC4617537.1 efflux RND transporter periplasmic adaptor subunit [Xanthomonas campestris pv. asclepiadis]
MITPSTTTTSTTPGAAGAAKGTPRRRLASVLAACVLAVVAIAGAGWWWSARAQPERDALAISALSVTAVTPRAVEWPSTLQASGLVAPWQEAIISSQSNGLRLSSLDVAVGDVVRRGQLLARFDTATLLAARAELSAGLAKAQAAASQADSNRGRALRLQTAGAISDQEVQRYVTEAVTAKAQIAVARAQLDANRLQLQQAQILAPDDGLISAQAATLGAVATSGQELFRLVRQGRLEWRGEFSPEQIARIAVGQQVGLRLPDGSVAMARVRQIAPLLDARSRLGLVYADIAHGSLLRGGMYVDGALELPASRALVVPASSVVVRDGRSTVFCLVGSGGQARVRAQQVVVGRRLGADVELLAPLAAGTRIVAQGAGLLADGDTVLVTSTSTRGLVGMQLLPRGRR